MTLPNQYELHFDSATGKKEVDQARALRLVHSYITDDFAQLMSISEEVARDERGSEIAVWELLVGLAGAVALQWVERGGEEVALEGIRRALIENATEGARS